MLHFLTIPHWRLWMPAGNVETGDLDVLPWAVSNLVWVFAILLMKSRIIDYLNVCQAKTLISLWGCPCWTVSSLATFVRRHSFLHCGSLYKASPKYVLVTSWSRKHAYSNIMKILLPKNENFQIKNSDILHISAQNIDCGYTLEPPRRGGSNAYPQSMYIYRHNVLCCLMSENASSYIFGLWLNIYHPLNRFPYFPQETGLDISCKLSPFLLGGQFEWNVKPRFL